ncbi:hypothetical protein E2C01_070122 [Portunus trituberculatus]|uniref:Uncharacterized protein n=1 Tax=Portunus trituberculatus TaxID=210409 RepID=A0A5B7I4B2_PORTR|nr:hypothetical protein [Portunus trituberculatus]
MDESNVFFLAACATSNGVARPKHMLPLPHPSWLELSVALCIVWLTHIRVHKHKRRVDAVFENSSCER